MSEFIAFFTQNEVTSAGIAFLMLAGCFVAIFHTVILSGLFGLDFRGWLFFVVNPLLILLVGIWDRQFVFFVFFLLFISVFVLGFTGMIYAGIIKSREEKRETDKFRKQYPVAPKPLWKNVSAHIAIALFLVSFYYLGPSSVFLLFIAIPVFSALLPSNKNRFLKYQGVLPAAKIRSVSMGLAEVEGSLESIESMLSPIKKKECIGYRYQIEKISTDSDGDKSYTTIFDETICNPFYISDETGRIKVNPDKLEFVFVAKDEMYSAGGKRYTQFLLKAHDKMLLIGKAGLGENNQPIFEYETVKNVFAIAPLEKITHYNTFKPLLNSFLLFTCVFAFMVSLILITPITIKDDRLIVGAPNFEFNWGYGDHPGNMEAIEFDVQNESELEDNSFQPQTAK